MESLLQGIVNGSRETQKALDKQTAMLKGILDVESDRADAEKKKLNQDKRDKRKAKRKDSDSQFKFKDAKKKEKSGKEEEKDDKGLLAALGGGAAALGLGGIGTAIGALTSALTVANSIDKGAKEQKSGNERTIKEKEEQIGRQLTKEEQEKLIIQQTQKQALNPTVAPGVQTMLTEQQASKEPSPAEEIIKSLQKTRGKGTFGTTMPIPGELGAETGVTKDLAVAARNVIAHNDKLYEMVEQMKKEEDPKEKEKLSELVDAQTKLLAAWKTKQEEASKAYDLAIKKKPSDAITPPEEVKKVEVDINVEGEKTLDKVLHKAHESELMRQLNEVALQEKEEKDNVKLTPVKKQKGGHINVPGQGSGDKVPMMLPSGSFVMNRNASMMLQQGGMVPTLLEPGEKVFSPGSWGPMEQMMNSTFGRFQTGGAIDEKQLKQGQEANANDKAPAGTKVLKVPYFNQRQNKVDGMGTGGDAQCFSTAAAMLISAVLDKNVTPNEYNVVRDKYGLSTSMAAQASAMRDFGVETTGGDNGSYASYKSSIDSGKPVILGLQHNTGSGHMVTGIGYNKEGIVVNDPYGRLNPTPKGGWAQSNVSGANDTKGMGVTYPKSLMDGIWLDRGNGTGRQVTPTKGDVPPGKAAPGTTLGNNNGGGNNGGNNGNGIASQPTSTLPGIVRNIGSALLQSIDPEGLLGGLDGLLGTAAPAAAINNQGNNQGNNSGDNNSSTPSGGADSIVPSGATGSFDEFYKMAETAGAKFPELVAAQWQLESAHGTAVSGKNNFFGQKGKGTTKGTQEFIGGKMVDMPDEFKDFATPQDSVNFLVKNWHKDTTAHGVGAENGATTAREAAYNMRPSAQGGIGYATDPDYVSKIHRILGENGYQNGGTIGNVSGASNSPNVNMVSKSQEMFAQKIAEAVKPIVIPMPSGGGNGGGAQIVNEGGDNDTVIPSLPSGDNSIMAMEYKYRITMGASI